MNAVTHSVKLWSLVFAVAIGLTQTACHRSQQQLADLINRESSPQTPPAPRIEFLAPQNLVSELNAPGRIVVLGQNMGTQPVISLTTVDQSYKLNCTTVSEVLPEGTQATCDFTMTKAYVGTMSLSVTTANGVAYSPFEFVDPAVTNPDPVISSFKVKMNPATHAFTLTVVATDNSGIDLVEFFRGSSAAKDGDPYIGKGTPTGNPNEWSYTWADPRTSGLQGDVYVYAWVTDNGKTNAGVVGENEATQSKILKFNVDTGAGAE